MYEPRLGERRRRTAPPSAPGAGPSCAPHPRCGRQFRSAPAGPR